jgi:hypothetical protein
VAEPWQFARREIQPFTYLAYCAGSFLLVQPVRATEYGFGDYGLEFRRKRKPTNRQYQYVMWLPFLNTYRTMCLAPQPDFRLVLEDVLAMQRAL